MHPTFSRCLLATAAILVGSSPSVAATTDSMPQKRIAEVYSSLPLTFEANAGQFDKRVRFLSRARGNTLFLTANEATLRLGDQKHGGSVVRMAWVGGDRHPRVLGETLLATKSNYLLGDEPSAWHNGVSHYASVRYVSVYPGIDLVFRGNQRQLEYDFILVPNADPLRIRLAFKGAEQITLGADGELVLHTAHGDLVQPAPKLYQEEMPGRRHSVEGHYVLLTTAHRKTATGSPVAPQQVGFVVGRYDRTHPLIIDPEVQFSTFLGGPAVDDADAIAVDSTGNTYITGVTQSTTFPGVSGSSIQATFGGGDDDVFVTKINAAGTAILYSTFLGGSKNDYAFAIAVDSAGNAYVVGSTLSPIFPGVSASSIQATFGGGGDDAFVTKINAAGTAILYSTFLGGSGTDLALGVAVDGAGNAYVTGLTNSLTFPGVSASSIQPAFAGGAFDVFVTKINSTGTALVYSTFLGGINDDEGRGIAVDGAGNAYLTGFTNSGAFAGLSGSSIQPAFGGGTYDAFVTKINSTGTAIVYSTFLGGSADDRGFGIAVDGTGNAYVTGWTGSLTFPGVNGSSIQPARGANDDTFVTKINSTGTAIIYSTFLGGAGYDHGNAIAVDGAGNAYIIGTSDSIDFPGVNGSSIQPTKGGDGNDAFVTKINSAGTAIAYSTYLGGSGDDQGLAIAVDGVGNSYITGYTNSPSFPGVTSGSLQPTSGGSYDAFVMKISFIAAGLDFYALTLCRLVDTRRAPGSLGGPALQPGATRIFALAGTCGIPSSARAASVNITVVGSSAAGYLTLWPSDETQPTTSNINYRSGDVRANNAIIVFSADGQRAMLVFTGSSSSVDFILDVNGYFQ